MELRYKEKVYYCIEHLTCCTCDAASEDSTRGSWFRCSDEHRHLISLLLSLTDWTNVAALCVV